MSPPEPAAAKPALAGAAAHRSGPVVEISATGEVVRQWRSAKILGGFSRAFATALVSEAMASVPGLPAARTAELRQRGPDALRDYLQGLGGSFVKFGQLLSMRYDMLPRRYCDTLEELFDRVPAFDVDIAKQIVAKELKAPIEDVFSDFDDVPIGAASFGQIHRVTIGRGADAGTRCVIKIQRPGSQEHFDSDARWLLFLGWLIDITSVLGQAKMRPVFRDFVRWTRREINFTQEAKNADRLHQDNDYNPHQRVPWIYWEFTTTRIVVMEYLDGMAVSDLVRRADARDPTLDDDLAAIDCDRETIARRILHNHYQQCFVGRVFHADPHPGNLIVLPGNIIGYVDFGLLGRMTPEDHREELALLDAVASRNIERMFVAVLDVLDAPRGLLVSDFFDDFHEAVDIWLDASDNPGASPYDKSVTNLVVACMDLARAIGLPLSMDAILYFKALMSVDSAILRLNPRQDYHAELVQTFRVLRLRMVERYMSPEGTVDRTLDTLLLAVQLPEFLKEQLILYQQTTRSMYRRVNQVPLVIAGGIRSLAGVCVAAALVLLPLDRGYADHIPEFLLKDAHLELLANVSAAWALFAVIAVVLWWLARVVASTALVKVQRNRE